MDVLVNELVDKFSVDEMKRICNYALDEDLETVTGADTKPDIFFDIVWYAKRSGELSRLLKECRKVNSNFSGAMPQQRQHKSDSTVNNYQVDRLIEKMTEVTVDLKFLTQTVAAQYRYYMTALSITAVISIVALLVAILK